MVNRMSASLMDGARERFSGVINPVRHPIELAQTLQNSTDRVLSDYGAVELCENPDPELRRLTDLRLQEWIQERQENFVKRWLGGSRTRVSGAQQRPTRQSALWRWIVREIWQLAHQLVARFERIGRVSDPLCQLGITPQPMQLSAVLGLGRHH